MAWTGSIVAAMLSGAWLAAGAVSGLVVDSATGKPLAGITVDVQGEARLSAKTDLNGRFRLDGLGDGEVRLAAEKTESHLRATVLARPDETDVILRMDGAGICRGRVVDADGDPVKNVLVSLRSPAYRDGRPSVNYYRATSDGEGRFVIGGVRKGKYVLSATPRMGATRGPRTEADLEDAPPVAVRTFYPRSTVLEGATAIEIGPDNHVDLRLELARAKTACVRLRAGAQAMDVTIHEVFAAVENTVFYGKAGAGEPVEVCGVPPGSYRVSSMLVGAETLYADHRFAVGRPMVYELPPLHFSKPQAFRGRLAWKNRGRPVPVDGVRVALRPVARGFVPGETSEVEVKADGSFVFDRLYGGEYWLDVAGVAAPLYVRAATKRGRDAYGAAVTIFDGDLEIEIGDDGAVLRGSVSDGQAGPPATTVAVAVSCSMVETLAPNQVMWSGLSAKGEFVFSGGAPGCYRVMGVAGVPLTRVTDPNVLSMLRECSVEVPLGSGGSRSVTVPLCRVPSFE